jgi:hypothetical protein
LIEYFPIQVGYALKEVSKMLEINETGTKVRRVEPFIGIEETGN